VEQFDVQQAELTVRETVLFSARLRLNSQDPNLAGDELKQSFVDHVLETLELTSLSKSVMGREGEGGLSFEQRKRVSIAVELAASPSVIFLDEVRRLSEFGFVSLRRSQPISNVIGLSSQPTSGLDARAALLVVKNLRKISDQGRTVVATIHQPSSAVFEMFVRVNSSDLS
jgi:ABC-type multidrug transport system ATPase subunit